MRRRRSPRSSPGCSPRRHIDDLAVLREGAVAKVLPGVKAASTLGTFLRGFTFGHVRQLGCVGSGAGAVARVWR